MVWQAGHSRSSFYPDIQGFITELGPGIVLVAQGLVDAVHHSQGFLGGRAGVTDHLTNHLPILEFQITRVVFGVCADSGERDLSLFASCLEGAAMNSPAGIVVDPSRGTGFGREPSLQTVLFPFISGTSYLSQIPPDVLSNSKPRFPSPPQPFVPTVHTLEQVPTSEYAGDGIRALARGIAPFRSSPSADSLPGFPFRRWSRGPFPPLDTDGVLPVRIGSTNKVIENL
ncbi:hypothetical protein Holit_00231 [Hollandina sp. SP2]